MPTNYGGSANRPQPRAKCAVTHQRCLLSCPAHLRLHPLPLSHRVSPSNGGVGEARLYLFFTTAAYHWIRRNGILQGVDEVSSNVEHVESRTGAMHLCPGKG